MAGFAELNPPYNDPADLQPPSPLEPQNRQNRAEHNQRQGVLIAPGPVELGHMLEIHSINARHQGWRDADDGNDRQYGKDVVLLRIDEAKHRIQQKLNLV